MELPEIRTLVGHYIRAKDIPTCVRVCIAWRDSFTSLLWHTLDTSVSIPQPGPDLLNTNGPWIRNLCLQDMDHLEIISQRCTGLESLTLRLRSLSMVRDPSLSWHLLSNLVLANLRLHSIRLTYECPTPTIEFLSAMVMSLSLKRLHINRCRFDGEQSEILYQLLPNLESFLAISNIIAPRLRTWHQDSIFSKMTCLGIRMEGRLIIEDQMALIQRCPNLTSLTFVGHIGHSMAYLATSLCEILSRDCPKVETLKLPSTDFSDKEQGRVLDATALLLKTLDLSADRDFGPVVFGSLRRHWSTLTHLDFWMSTGVTSRINQQLLVSCPRLISIRSTQISAADILSTVQSRTDLLHNSFAQSESENNDGGEWTCLGLETFDIFIYGLYPEQLDLQKAIYQRLGRLSKLSKLSFGKMTGMALTDALEGLSLRRESGLTLLAPLKRIREVRFRGVIQVVQVEDVEWMREHWRGLEVLDGNLQLTELDHDKVQDLLKQGEVDLRLLGLVKQERMEKSL